MRIKTCIEKIRNKFCIKFYKLYYFVHVFYVDVFVFKRFILFFLVMSLKLSFARVTHMQWLCVHVIIIIEKTAN